MHLHQGCVRWSPVLSGVGVEEGDAGGESLGRRQETLRPAGCPEGGWHQGVHADFPSQERLSGPHSVPQEGGAPVLVSSDKRRSGRHKPLPGC